MQLGVDMPKSADLPWPAPLCESVPQAVSQRYMNTDDTQQQLQQQMVHNSVVMLIGAATVGVWTPKKFRLRVPIWRYPPTVYLVTCNWLLNNRLEKHFLVKVGNITFLNDFGVLNTNIRVTKPKFI